MATATKQQLIDRIKQMPDLPIVCVDNDGATSETLHDWDIEDFVKVEEVFGHFEDKNFYVDHRGLDDHEKHKVILING